MAVEIVRPSSIFQVSGIWYASNPPAGTPTVAMIDEDVAAGDGDYVYCLGGGRLNVFFPAPSLAGPYSRLVVRGRVRRDPSASGSAVTVRLYAAAAYTDQAVNLPAGFAVLEWVFDGAWSAGDLGGWHVQMYQSGGDGLVNLDALEVKVYDSAEPGYWAHPRLEPQAPSYLVPPVRGYY